MKATSFFRIVFALTKRWSKTAMWVIIFLDCHPGLNAS